MGKKSSKATKKFQKAHLGRELTQRKHDAKKKAIREKGMAKYVDEHAKGGPAQKPEEADEDDELAVPEAARTGAEREVFQAKAKLKPSANAAHKLDRRPAASSAASSAAGGYTKPASKKAPSIEDLDGVDSFMDAGYLDDDAQPQVDQSAIEDGEDDDDEDEDGDAAMSGDAGSDDEGDDGEDADGAAEGDAESAALLAEIEAHEAELANLATTDPEFYSHLKQHDKSLLDFNKEEEMADDQDDDDDEEGDALADEEQGGQKKELEVLDWSSLKSLQSQVIGPVWSLRALKKLIRIFRSAVHIGEIASSKGGKVKAISEKQAEKEAAFRQEVRIDSPRVYNELIRFTLKEADKIWRHHFKPEGAAAGKAGKKDSASSASSPAVFAHLDKHPKWSTLGPVLKAFLGHVLHFLTSLHANPRMARFVLGALESLVILLDPFPKLAAKVLRELLAFWSQSEKDVRIDAFLRIRQMAIELSANRAAGGAGGESMLELVLKGIYLTYVRNSKFSGELTLPVIEFMANCVVELYGLEPTLAYQYAFVYIRQCAIHLRTALLVKKKDAHRAVYNWNFINCLRVWGKVLAVHGVSNAGGKDAASAAQDNLSALVYPYVQICLGTLGVMQSSRYFPLRFHVVRMLIDLAGKVGIFVPLAPYLLAVLHAPELGKKPTSSTKKQADIAFILKVSPGILATKVCQEVFVAEALSLLLSYFELYAHSIAFPELVLPAIKILRKTQKDVVIHRVRKQIQSLILKLEHNASWVIQKRNGTQWTPKDMNERKKGVEGLRTFDARIIGAEGYAAAIGGAGKGAQANQQAPLTKYVSVALEERRALDESKADWDGSRGSRNEPKGGKKGAGSKGSDDEDEEAEKQEKYERKNRGGGDDDDDDDDDEGEEDEEGDEDGEDGGSDDEDEDEDAPKSKKARKDSASSAPRNPFSYPSGLDAEAASGEGDMLQELAFSDDDDDDAPKRKQKKQQQKPKQAKQQKPQGKPASKPAANGVKKEGGAGSQKKPQQQQKQSTKKPQQQQQAGKRKRN